MLILSQNVSAAVDAKNYNFSLDQLKAFMPGEQLATLDATNKTKTYLYARGKYKVYKYYITQLRYKFPVMVQATKKGQITDFHAKLPSYFLHNLFHQALINRLGKQNQYKLSDEHAVYVWNNVNNNQHIYSGGCSITCFPIYYSVKTNTLNADGNYHAIIKQLQNRHLNKTGEED